MRAGIQPIGSDSSRSARLGCNRRWRARERKSGSHQTRTLGPGKRHNSFSVEVPYGDPPVRIADDRRDRAVFAPAPRLCTAPRWPRAAAELRLYSTTRTDTTWSAARQPRQGAPHAGNQASGRSGPTARSSRRSRRISSPWSIIIRTLRLLARPLKRSSCNCGAAIAGRVVLHNRSSAAALGLRGAVHKRGSSEKTAHPYSGPSVTRHRAPFRFEVQSAARAVRPAHRATGWLDFRWVFRALASLLAAVYGENRSRAR